MPGHVSVNPRRSSISLKFTIVGGSIAGLASAYSLQKAGHEVIVLEKNDRREKSRGGLRSPPNMTRLLNQWGLGPSLDKYGHRCTQFVFYKGENGELIAIMKLHEEFLKHLMADFLFIQHGDLHSMLYELAIQEGVQIRYGAKVVHVDSAIVSVDLENGEQITSDVVIGADGFSSLVRTAVIGKEVPEVRGRDITLNFTIPTAVMRQDEDLKPLTNNTDWAVWLGDQYMLHGSLVNSDRDFSVTLGYTLSDDLSEYNEGWKGEYPLEHFNLDLQKFEPRVRKMLSLATDITPHIYISRPHLESFVCDRARLVLVGEAAHPLLPSGQHNTALGIEDAQTLGSLFSGIEHRDHVPQLLAAYEELRQARCISAQEWERRKRVMLTLPGGEEQERRDMRLRDAMAYGEWDHMDEKIFKEMWGEELDLLVYDASEKVEDWWTKWGPLLVREGTNRRSLAPNVRIESSSKAE